MAGVTPSGSGCQPTASAADASSQSGIPNADEVLVEALNRAILFTAYDRDDPLAIRFEFASDEGRLAAANAVEAALQQAPDADARCEQLWGVALEALETTSWLLADMAPDGMTKRKVDRVIAQMKSHAATFQPISNSADEIDRLQRRLGEYENHWQDMLVLLGIAHDNLHHCTAVLSARDAATVASTMRQLRDLIARAKGGAA